MNEPNHIDLTIELAPRAPQPKPRETMLAPIRYAGRHVGRNEACPCKSGQKFKNCCMGAKPNAFLTLAPIRPQQTTTVSPEIPRRS